MSHRPHRTRNALRELPAPLSGRRRRPAPMVPIPSPMRRISRSPRGVLPVALRGSQARRPRSLGEAPSIQWISSKESHPLRLRGLYQSAVRLEPRSAEPALNRTIPDGQPARRKQRPLRRFAPGSGRLPGRERRRPTSARLAVGSHQDPVSRRMQPRRTTARSPAPPPLSRGHPPPRPEVRARMGSPGLCPAVRPTPYEGEARPLQARCLFPMPQE